MVEIGFKYMSAFKAGTFSPNPGKFCSPLLWTVMIGPWNATVAANGLLSLSSRKAGVGVQLGKVNRWEITHQDEWLHMTPDQSSKSAISQRGQLDHQENSYMVLTNNMIETDQCRETAWLPRRGRNHTQTKACFPSVNFLIVRMLPCHPPWERSLI